LPGSPHAGAVCIASQRVAWPCGTRQAGPRRPAVQSKPEKREVHMRNSASGWYCTSFCIVKASSSVGCACVFRLHAASCNSHCPEIGALSYGACSSPADATELEKKQAKVQAIITCRCCLPQIPTARSDIVATPRKTSDLTVHSRATIPAFCMPSVQQPNEPKVGCSRPKSKQTAFAAKCLRTALSSLF